MFVRVVIRVHLAGEQDLPRVAHAFDGMCLLLGFAQRRQEHPRQDRNNGDDHQKLNQREGAVGVLCKFHFEFNDQLY